MTGGGNCRRTLVELAAVGDRVHALTRLREEYTRIGARVAKETNDVIGELVGMGMSMRDAADLLGLSHQRVAQLATKSGTKARSGPGSRTTATVSRPNKTASGAARKAASTTKRARND